jgi:hypothetical protein
MHIFGSASCGGGGAGAKIRDEGPKIIVPGGYKEMSSILADQ